MIENISATPLLTELLIYSDFLLPASSDHLGFWCLSCHPFTRQELGILHIKYFWTSSLTRNNHYHIRFQRTCPQGHKIFSTRNLSGQAMLWRQKRQCRRQLLIFVRGQGGWTKAGMLSKKHDHGLELCPITTAQLAEWSILELSQCPGGNWAWQITRLPKPNSARSPHHPAPCPSLEEAPGN